MEYLESLMDISPGNWVDFLIKTFLLLSSSAFFLGLAWFVIVKSLGKRTRLHRDVFLRLSFLWSAFIALLAFNVYWFYLIRFNGLHNFNWASPVFYHGMGPCIVSYLILIILFVAYYTRYKSILKL